MAGSCGTCTLCCKLLGIKELNKPNNVWCPNCDKGVGCRAYSVRPESCRIYSCIWLQSQDDPQPMPLSFRPDKSKCVLTCTFDSAGHEVFTVHVDPGFPLAWQEPAMAKLLRIAVGKGIKVCIRVGDRTQVINRDGVVRDVKLSQPDVDGQQWVEAE